MPILRGNGTFVGIASSISPGATGGPLYLTKNGAGAPPYSFAGDTNTGLDSSAADTLDLVTGGTSRFTLNTTTLTLTLPIALPAGTAASPAIRFVDADSGWVGGVGPSGKGTAYNVDGASPAGGMGIDYDGIDILNTTGGLFFRSATGNYSGSRDLALVRLTAASIRQGLDPSATPVAQTFTLGESSRPGTDTNVGGSAGTIRPGLGTGTGTAPKFAIQGVVLAASGSGVQSYQDMIAVTGVALGFYNATPVALQTGVAVSAAGIHAALVNLGLITA